MTSTEHPHHWRWKATPADPGPSVCVDIDGVLADAQHRQHLVEAWLWDEFFEKCGDDGLIGANALMVALLDPALTVVLLTSRPHWIQGETLDWLARHHVRWDLLVMRPSSEMRSSAVFKGNEVERLRTHGYPPTWAIDDSPRNIAAYTKLDVPCTYIESGYY